jgi:hypothetical protein
MDRDEGLGRLRIRRQKLELIRHSPEFRKCMGRTSRGLSSVGSRAPRPRREFMDQSCAPAGERMIKIANMVSEKSTFRPPEPVANSGAEAACARRRIGPDHCLRAGPIHRLNGPRSPKLTILKLGAPHEFTVAIIGRTVAVAHILGIYHANTRVERSAGILVTILRRQAYCHSQPR